MSSERRPTETGDERGTDLTIALTVRHLAVVAAVVGLVLAVLVQGRRWRAR